MDKKEITEIAFPEVTSLQLTDGIQTMIETMPEHRCMLETIKNSMPEIHRATSLFFKTQSQFMDNMMTVSHYTPLRNLRQILAEMTRTREALREAHFKLKKKDVQVRQKQRSLSKEKDELKAEMLEIEIAEIISEAEVMRGYVSGAIRKLANYTNEYNSILSHMENKNFSEEDFEKEEVRYHIMRAFDQAMCAARTRNGQIDEGNMIYLTQLGINGAHAQYEVTIYLNEEQALLRDEKAPTHEMYRLFLERMANIFQNNPKDLAAYKGMSVMNTDALLQTGDTRLLEKKQ